MVISAPTLLPLHPEIDWVENKNISPVSFFTITAFGVFEWLVNRPAGVRLPPSRAGAISSCAAMSPVANTPLPWIGDVATSDAMSPGEVNGPQRVVFPRFRAQPLAGKRLSKVKSDSCRTPKGPNSTPSSRYLAFHT